MQGNGRRQIYLRFGASLVATRGSVPMEERRAKYFARGRRDRCGESFLCAGAFSPGDGERLFRPRLQDHMDSTEADRRRICSGGSGVEIAFRGAGRRQNVNNLSWVGSALKVGHARFF